MEWFTNPNPDAIFWVWVERVSWMVAVLALALTAAGLWIAFYLGLPQLRFIRSETKRLADDAARRPQITVGFADRSSDAIPTRLVDRLTITPRISHTTYGFTVPELVTFFARNDGDRTAHHPAWSYNLPAPVAVPNEREQDLKHIARMESGQLRLLFVDDTLHPDASVSHSVRLQFPAPNHPALSHPSQAQATYPVVCFFVMDDARRQEFHLYIDVRMPEAGTV